MPADNKQRDESMNCIKISIDGKCSQLVFIVYGSALYVVCIMFYLVHNGVYFCRQTNTVAIHNNGRGIPVVEHSGEKLYVPELIFGTLLTSSNYDDSERKTTGKCNLTRWCSAYLILTSYNVWACRWSKRLRRETVQYLQQGVLRRDEQQKNTRKSSNRYSTCRLITAYTLVVL